MKKRCICKYKYRNGINLWEYYNYENARNGTEKYIISNDEYFCDVISKYKFNVYFYDEKELRKKKLKKLYEKINV